MHVNELNEFCFFRASLGRAPFAKLADDDLRDNLMSGSGTLNPKPELLSEVKVFVNSRKSRGIQRSECL